MPFAIYCIKQNSTIKNFGCQADFKLSGRAIVSKELNKVNIKLKLFYRQRETSTFRKLLWNTLHRDISVMDVPYDFFFCIDIWKRNFKKLKTNIFAFS